MAKAKSKTEKKIDNNIRLALTAACDQFLEDIPGFQWLTHQANYTNFPASLMITCVFDTDESCDHADKQEIYKVIQGKLLKIGVKFKSPEKQITFDSEEACAMQDEANWTNRLARLSGRAVPQNRPSQH